MTTSLADFEETTEVAEPPAAKWVPQQFIDPNFRSYVVAELDRLYHLEPGWDGYRASRIDPKIIDAARGVLFHMAENLGPRPRVVPLASGALQFEWVAGRVALDLEFESPTTIHFLQWNPGAQISVEDTFQVTDIDRVESLIKWFARQHA